MIKYIIKTRPWGIASMDSLKKIDEFYKSQELVIKAQKNFISV